jgi:outer membrane protein TolC
MKSSLIYAVILSLLVAGCAVGPNFKKPAPPNTGSYTTTPLPANTSSTASISGGEAQHFVQGLDIPGQWWMLFHSQSLNELIGRALTNNPDLAAAQAALAVAHENVLAQNGAWRVLSQPECRFLGEPPKNIQSHRPGAQ